jgi:hypothetical protein
MRELLPVIGSSVFFDLLKSILLLLILLIARTVLVRWIKGNHTSDHRREATMDRDGSQQHGAGALSWGSW